MTDLSTKTVLVYDYGSQVAVAQRLSRDMGRVLYFIPSVINGFKDHKAHGIGRGIPGIERVDDFWEYYHEIDLFVFTDIHDGGLQEFLRLQNKVVFGGGRASALESERLKFKELISELGLPVNEYDVAYGMTDLENKLRDVDDRYIKGKLRGDMETWFHKNITLSKSELDRMRHDLGTYQEKETYIIETPIEAVAEIGYDGYVINGAFPEISCCGIEVKDKCYVGRMIRNNYLPKQLKEVNDKIAPILQTYGYCSAFSTEVRVAKDKVGYFIDPTLRFPEPNTALTLEMYENYSEIIWNVANGIVPNIKYKYEWGCQFIVKSDLAKTEPIAFQFPEEYRNNIKIKNLTIDEFGVSWYNPNNVEMSECAAVVGMGQTMDQAILMASEIAKTVKGFDIKINTDCTEEANKQIKELRKNGIIFL